MNQKNDIYKEILSHANSEQAFFLSKFFKTGKGEYAEGDKFLGIRVPVSRKLANTYKNIDLLELNNLIQSSYHEMRLISLIILANKFMNSDAKLQKKIYDLYITNTKYINNWDLVDESAPKIPGKYLLDKKRDILYTWVKSTNLWERRIAIMSTFTFIRNNDFFDTLRLCEILLSDTADLIHKASGWMLREIYKRDSKVLTQFLDNNISKMPRTMLRYAIEKYPENQRKKLLER